MAYPTIKIEIEDYDWFVNVYEMTEREKQLISKCVKEDDNTGILNVLIGLVKEWNCTNRQGDLLPVSVDSLEELPQSVIEKILTFSANPKRSILSPKSNSSSSLPTQKEVVASEATTSQEYA